MLLNLVEHTSSWGTAVDGCISIILVLFAGTVSGLTLGLMSLDLVEMEVLQRSGTPQEQKQAAAIFPVVKKQHQLLVTLLLCNALAMEALPIFLDNIFNEVVAVILSVTFVLIFGEFMCTLSLKFIKAAYPQETLVQEASHRENPDIAKATPRYGLAIGANLVWLVRILMVICFPVAYPVGKLLDLLLGHSNAGMFRRAQLKALVSIHGEKEGKGGELTIDETTIISGALDLTLKKAEEAMTPIESTFSLDIESKLDWEVMGKILATGHSRIPVYSGSPKNIIGLLLVKSLLTVRAEAETPINAVSIRRIPRVPADMPLYDILNEFQKGQSHMAAVVRSNIKSTTEDNDNVSAPKEEKSHDSDEKATSQVKIDIEKRDDDSSDNTIRNQEIAKGGSMQSEETEVIGIITLEDVIEELLQEEIVDETDEYVDVHKRIRVPKLPSRTASAVRILTLSRKNSRHAHSQKLLLDKQEKADSKLSGLKQPLLEKQ